MGIDKKDTPHDRSTSAARTDVAQAEACLDGHDLVQNLLSSFLLLLLLLARRSARCGATRCEARETVEEKSVFAMSMLPAPVVHK